MSSYLNPKIAGASCTQYGALERLILLVVDAYGGATGACRLSNTYIAACCGVHEKTVSRSLRGLIETKAVTAKYTTRVGRTLRELKLSPDLHHTVHVPQPTEDGVL